MVHLHIIISNVILTAYSGKPSVRVRQPPGGGSSLNLFGGENPAPLKEAKVFEIRMLLLNLKGYPTG